MHWSKHVLYCNGNSRNTLPIMISGFELVRRVLDLFWFSIVAIVFMLVAFGIAFMLTWFILTGMP